MATVSTPATLGSVKSVFGGNSTLYGYRRGGGLVPSIAAYSAVDPTTPRLASFAGLVYPAVQFDNQPYSAYGADMYDIITPNNPFATAYIDAFSNGALQMFTADSINGTTRVVTATWRLVGNSSDYDIYFHKTGGSVDADGSQSGTVNTWLNLASTREWGVSQDGIIFAITTMAGTITIRPAGGGANLVSASVLLSAEMTTNE